MEETNQSAPVVDLDAVNAWISTLSHEDMRKTLFDIKVKEKVATKKAYKPSTAKKARITTAAKRAAIIAKAKEMGIYDEINKQAAEEAKKRFTTAPTTSLSVQGGLFPIGDSQAA